MAEHSSRLEQLRRRADSDPAPFVIAQLAEEYCRAGCLDEAVGCCRSLLDRHPKYFNARLVLGRALAAQGHVDEAVAELEQVLAAAPEHLAAMKDLAELQERIGRPADALRWYRRAVTLAPTDRHLEDAVARLERVNPADEHGTVPEQVQQPAVDFDDLLARLGHPNQPVPPLVETLLTDPERLLGGETAPRIAETPMTDRVDVAGADSMAGIEATIRLAAAESSERIGSRGSDSRTLPAAEAEAIRRLERWLDALKREHAAY